MGLGHADPRRAPGAGRVLDLERRRIRALVRDRRRVPQRDRGPHGDPGLPVLVARRLHHRHPHHLRPRRLRWRSPAQRLLNPNTARRGGGPPPPPPAPAPPPRGGGPPPSPPNPRPPPRPRV